MQPIAVACQSPPCLPCAQSICAEQEETSCYDLTPDGGDYNVEYGTPTQLNNLSPWANAIRTSIGVPKAGTIAQQAKCSELLESLRWAGG